MREITRKTVAKFIAKEPIKIGNTKVEVRDGMAYYYLHDNCIAILDDVELFISTCGWKSVTTKERLNGIIGTILGFKYKIYQKNFIWYIGDDVFDHTKAFKLNK